MTSNSIDARATPRQVWLTLSKDGVKKGDNVFEQGQVYTYVEKSILGNTFVPRLVISVGAIFSGVTTSMVQLSIKEKKLMSK